MPLFSANGVVSRSQEPLPGVGYGKNPVDRTTGSPTEGDDLGSEYDLGSEMDRREYNEVSGSGDANGRVNIRDRLQQETRVV